MCLAHVRVRATEPPHSAPQKPTVLELPDPTLTVSPRHLYPTDSIQGFSIDTTVRPNATQATERATQERANPGGADEVVLHSTNSDSTSDILQIRQVLSNSSQADEWSDEFLQELDRLGEGAGGAVQKVKDKRTGMMMARKTITTREASTRQLNRELTFMSSTSHPNIVKFHAAYISPPSSDIKLLMELCEGRSLEAVGERLREKGWRPGEKVAGTLAEGVSLDSCLAHTSPSRNPLCPDPSNLPPPLGVLDITRIGIPAP